MDKDLLTLPSSKVENDLTRQMQQITALQPFLAMLAGDSSLDVVGEMVVALLETPSYDIAVEHLKRDPGSAALIEERYMALPHDLETLLQYPPDSLGYLYSMAMKTKGFRAEDLYEEIPIYSDASYVEARLILFPVPHSLLEMCNLFCMSTHNTKTQNYCSAGILPASNIQIKYATADQERNLYAVRVFIFIPITI